MQIDIRHAKIWLSARGYVYFGLIFNPEGEKPRKRTGKKGLEGMDSGRFADFFPKNGVKNLRGKKY